MLTKEQVEILESLKGTEAYEAACKLVGAHPDAAGFYKGQEVYVILPARIIREQNGCLHLGVYNSHGNIDGDDPEEFEGLAYVGPKHVLESPEV